MWTPRLIENARMKYLGIVEALDADIRSGVVVAGQRLPAQRAIAEALGVDLTTVTRAFNEARRRGLVQAQPGRGTFISEVVEGGGSPASPLIDLSMNIPPQPDGIDFSKLIPQGIGALLSTPRGLLSLQYQQSTGTEPDRQAAASWLSTRINGVASDRIVVTGGAQGALFASSPRRRRRNRVGDLSRPQGHRLSEGADDRASRHGWRGRPAGCA